MSNIVHFVLKLLFGNSDSGDLIISSNVPEVVVHTGWTPKQVYINLHNEHGHNVCGSHHDWFDVKIVRHGFIVRCLIKSSFRKITWVATK